MNNRNNGGPQRAGGDASLPHALAQLLGGRGFTMWTPALMIGMGDGADPGGKLFVEIPIPGGGWIMIPGPDAPPSRPDRRMFEAIKDHKIVLVEDAIGGLFGSRGPSVYEAKFLDWIMKICRHVIVWEAGTSPEFIARVTAVLATEKRVLVILTDPPHGLAWAEAIGRRWNEHRVELFAVHDSPLGLGGTAGEARRARR